jgi:hypothetical protein
MPALRQNGLHSYISESQASFQKTNEFFGPPSPSATSAPDQRRPLGLWYDQAMSKDSYDTPATKGAELDAIAKAQGVKPLDYDRFMSGEPIMPEGETADMLIEAALLAKRRNERKPALVEYILPGVNVGGNPTGRHPKPDPRSRRP